MIVKDALENLLNLWEKIRNKFHSCLYRKFTYKPFHCMKRWKSYFRLKFNNNTAHHISVKSTQQWESGIGCVRLKKNNNKKSANNSSYVKIFYLKLNKIREILSSEKHKKKTRSLNLNIAGIFDRISANNKVRNFFLFLIVWKEFLTGIINSF